MWIKNVKGELISPIKVVYVGERVMEPDNLTFETGIKAVFSKDYHEWIVHSKRQHGKEYASGKDEVRAVSELYKRIETAIKEGNQFYDAQNAYQTLLRQKEF